MHELLLALLTKAPGDYRHALLRVSSIVPTRGMLRDADLAKQKRARASLAQPARLRAGIDVSVRACESRLASVSW